MTVMGMNFPIPTSSTATIMRTMSCTDWEASIHPPDTVIKARMLEDRWTRPSAATVAMNPTTSTTSWTDRRVWIRPSGLPCTRKIIVPLTQI